MLKQRQAKERANKMGEVHEYTLNKILYCREIIIISSLTVATFFHFGFLSFNAKSLRHFKHTQIVANLCPFLVFEVVDYQPMWYSWEFESYE